MKVREVSVYRSQTFNLGEYNSVKLSIEMSAAIEDGDNPEECAKALNDMCRDATREAAAPFVRFVQLPAPTERAELASTVEIERAFLGRPLIED